MTWYCPACGKFNDSAETVDTIAPGTSWELTCSCQTRFKIVVVYGEGDDDDDADFNSKTGGY